MQTTEAPRRPKVGVEVIVRKDAKILIGKRLTKHGNGSWSLPGGHLEFMEEPEECALREVLEETGLTVLDPKVIRYSNDISKQDQTHYISINVIANWNDGEPEVLEPDKCAEWRWASLSELPDPLSMPLQRLLESEVLGDHFS